MKAQRVHVRSRPLAFLVLAAAAVAACGEEAPEASGPPPVVEVTTLTAKAQDTPVAVDFVAKTASSRRVEIRSRVDGFLESREYEEGSMVEEGQILFEMDKKPFQARLELAKAELEQQEARLTTAKQNLDRIKPLAEKRAVAQRELDDAEGFYREAKAAVEGAKANVVDAELKLGYTTIRSPVAGLSSYATKREGAYVGMVEPEPLTYIAQLHPMWVEFSVSENQLLKSRSQVEKGILRSPEGESFDVEIVFADGSVYPHTGRITFADASLSERTGTFLIRAEIDNEAGEMRPGQFVTARLKGAVRPNAILLPQRAVQQGAKGSFVWVLGADGKAEFRPVTVGPFHGNEWFIETGLEDGETVVVDGAQRLRAGAVPKVVPMAAAAAGTEGESSEAESR